MSDETAATDSHPCYEDIASSRRDSAQYREGYSEAERAFRIGLAVGEPLSRCRCPGSRVGTCGRHRHRNCGPGGAPPR